MRHHKINKHCLFGDPPPPPPAPPLRPIEPNNIGHQRSIPEHDRDLHPAFGVRLLEAWWPCSTAAFWSNSLGLINQEEASSGNVSSRIVQQVSSAVHRSHLPYIFQLQTSRHQAAVLWKGMTLDARAPPPQTRRKAAWTQSVALFSRPPEYPCSIRRQHCGEGVIGEEVQGKQGHAYRIRD